jgi:hypothetical protein
LPNTTRIFFADVSISKCKAAKKIVSDKLLPGLREEYTKVYDYQLELLRSNLGGIIVVCLDPKVMEQNIFQRFYVCFSAMKKGFKVGCRKVIGLDGCFFSKEHVKVSFYVQLEGMLIIRCILLLGQL